MTTTQLETVLALFTEGKTNKEIAAALGVTPGVVAGLLHRERMRRHRAGEPTLATVRGHDFRKRPRRPLKPPAPEFPAAPDDFAPPVPPPLPATNPRQCLWLSGDRPFEQCGGVRVDGRPYCAEHVRRAYVPTRGAGPAVPFSRKPPLA